MIKTVNDEPYKTRPFNIVLTIIIMYSILVSLSLYRNLIKQFNIGFEKQ